MKAEKSQCDSLKTFYPSGTNNAAEIAKILRECRLCVFRCSNLSHDLLLPLAAKGGMDRVEKLLEGTKGTFVERGKIDRETGKVGISVVRDVEIGDALLDEELFAPIMPIVPIAVRTYRA